VCYIVGFDLLWRLLAYTETQSNATKTSPTYLTNGVSVADGAEDAGMRAGAVSCGGGGLSRTWRLSDRSSATERVVTTERGEAPRCGRRPRRYGDARRGTARPRLDRDNVRVRVAIRSRISRRASTGKLPLVTWLRRRSCASVISTTTTTIFTDSHLRCRRSLEYDVPVCLLRVTVQLGTVRRALLVS